ncbi:MAG: amidohydrolase [Syntrophomonadaceae bacterium]|nr:amidohydrolase [Syntrophomonadaceae bacterium]
MLFKDITILDEDLNIRTNMYVGVRGDKIAYIGDKEPEEDYGAVYSGYRRLLMSAFYNGHAHTPMVLLRGYGENMTLQNWLNKLVFPFEDKLTNDAVYWGTTLGLAESLRFGVVSQNDMYFFCEDMARAVLECGIKSNISRSVVCFTDDDLWDMPSYKEAKSFFENFHGAGAGRLAVDMSLHAEYTSTPKVARQLAEYTRSIGARMHAHVAETKLETEECRQRHGKSPVRYLNDLGLFDSPTVAAHCVWLDEGDYEILAEKGVTVATCPVSNLKLASGLCNQPRLVEHGINLAIGTDGVASNNSINFLEDMKFFAVVYKGAYSDPTVITPREVLYAATRGGALSQGRDDCGKLAVGYKADLIVLDIGKPNMQPEYDLINNIVYSACGGDVVQTMVDGKVLYRNGEFLTIDIERVTNEVQRSVKGILAQL